MTEQIGTWCRREQRQFWHLVESFVAEDAITRCGRRMRNEPNSRGDLVFTDGPGPKCKQCQPLTQEQIEAGAVVPASVVDEIVGMVGR